MEVDTMKNAMYEAALQLCYAYYIDCGNTQEEATRMFKGLPANEVYRVCACICMEQAGQKYLGKTE